MCTRRCFTSEQFYRYRCSTSIFHPVECAEKTCFKKLIEFIPSPSLLQHWSECGISSAWQPCARDSSSAHHPCPSSRMVLSQHLQHSLEVIVSGWARPGVALCSGAVTAHCCVLKRRTLSLFKESRRKHAGFIFK